MSDNLAKELLWGQTKELLLPSGRTLTIREQNGHDDDVLSSVPDSKDLSNIDRFISGIVVEAPFTSSKVLTLNDVKNLLLRDKYFILFASRVHSIGSEISFVYDWGKDNGGEIPYKEDLTNYLWDYTEEFPSKGMPGYFKDRIEPYPENAYSTQTFFLSSGKELSFNCLDGHGEKYLLALPIESLTKNVELKARNIAVKGQDGKFVKVDNFTFFTKKDMMEIHSYIDNFDRTFRGLTEIRNPVNGQYVDYPIMQSQDFFYPQEI